MPKTAKPKSLNYHLAIVSECIRDVRAENIRLHGQLERLITLIDHNIATKSEAMEQESKLNRKAELRGAIGVLQSLRIRLSNVRRTNRRRKSGE